MAEETLWGIHAGNTGAADSLFLNMNCIAIGWNEVGDLLKIKNDQETFKEVIRKTYLGIKPGAIPNNAGQLRRFAYEMQPNDLVIYPSKKDRLVHIGRITG